MKQCSKCHRVLREDSFKKVTNRQCIRCIAVVRRIQVANPESERKRRKKWRDDNPEKAREGMMVWRRANPEKVRGYRRARIYSDAKRRRIYSLVDGMCGICGVAVVFEEMTIDHKYPHGLGGGNEDSNLQIAHSICNLRKAAKV